MDDRRPLGPVRSARRDENRPRLPNPVAKAPARLRRSRIRKNSGVRRMRAVRNSCEFRYASAPDGARSPEAVAFDAKNHSLRSYRLGLYRPYNKTSRFLFPAGWREPWTG